MIEINEQTTTTLNPRPANTSHLIDPATLMIGAPLNTIVYITLIIKAANTTCHHFFANMPATISANRKGGSLNVVDPTAAPKSAPEGTWFTANEMAIHTTTEPSVMNGQRFKVTSGLIYWYRGIYPMRAILPFLEKIWRSPILRIEG